MPLNHAPGEALSFLHGSEALGVLEMAGSCQHTYMSHTLFSPYTHLCVRCAVPLTRGNLSLHAVGNVCGFTCHARLSPSIDGDCVTTLWASCGACPDCLSLIMLVSINNRDTEI